VLATTPSGCSRAVAGLLHQAMLPVMLSPLLGLPEQRHSIMLLLLLPWTQLLQQGGRGATTAMLHEAIMCHTVWWLLPAEAMWQGASRRHRQPGSPCPCACTVRRHDP
jgi:hypothetical protein